MAPSNYYSGSSDLCLTPACINLASEILSNLATNYTEIDPCTDFDQLACGNWAARYAVPAGETSYDVLDDSRERVFNTLKQILEAPYPSGSDAGWITVILTEDKVKVDKANFAKIKNTYDVCMNYEAQEEQGLKYLVKFVETVVDAFPAAAYSNGTVYGVHDYAAAVGKTLVLFEGLGIETTQKFAQTPDFLNPDEMILSIAAPEGLYVPSSEEETEEFLGLASTLLAAVHPADITINRAKKLVKAVLEFQGTLAGLLATANEEEADTDPTAPPSKVPLSEIQSLAPQLNYEYVVEKLAPEGYDADQVYFTASSYYKGLSQLISKTSPEILQAFFVMKAVSYLSPYVESEATNALNDFITKLNGGDVESPRPRWRQCVELLVNDQTGLTWILSRFFVDKHYTPEAKELTSLIVNTLEESFLERLETRDWATDAVRDASAEKVRAILSKIALPTNPNLIDPFVLNEYYSLARITSSHAANILSLVFANVNKGWKSLGRPVDHGVFGSSTLITNAFYSPQSNSIELEAAIQQFPLYGVDFPSYIIYGGMGSVVGHEITHGFDNTGRLFDLDGNLTTWWDESSIEAFEEKTTCFIEQYSNYTITGPDGSQVPVDGEKTLGENLADAGGVVSSFAAWKKYEAERGEAKSLPGLHMFTHEQLFFLKWGQSWCQIIKPEDAVAHVTGSDNHSPNAARITLTLSNSAEFKKAYNCPVKEPVCELW
ncbi:hypothetical protein B0J13DRAFT_680938 [Dactylonectria estremocensis]|uniref:Endothelin-converting enzyme 1 n=1 Tax=Dactylonectria estremocensis TaxID=1079267 RepID=A0A9P9DGM2_9HYPO|nr:hypothetical protein B0J13DRAFT_680938 [Dactylonectria estremocensis]